MADLSDLQFNPETEIEPLNKKESAFFHYHRVFLPSVERFNKVVAQTSSLKNLSPLEVVQRTAGSRAQARIFSIAADVSFSPLSLSLFHL